MSMAPQLHCGVYQQTMPKDTINVNTKAVAWEQLSGPNPMFNQTRKFTAYEVFKFIIPFLLLLPIRMVLGFFGLLMMVLFANLTVLGLSDDAIATHPLSPCRQALLKPARWGCRFILFGFGYWWLTIRGKPSPDARIVIANHISFIDGLVLAYLLPGSFVSRKENEAWPFVGTMIRATQCLSVSRSTPASRKHVAATITSRAKDHAWPRIIMFPEGTTGNGTGLLTFRQGAFNPGLPVQACLLQYPHRHFDISFTFGTSVPIIMLRCIAQWYNSVVVTWLEPYHPPEDPKDQAIVTDCAGPPTNFTKEHVNAYMNDVRQGMAKQLHIPMVPYSYGDVQLWGLAERLGLSFDVPLVNVAEAEAKYAVRPEMVRDLLKVFIQRYHIQKVAKVDYPRMLECLQLPDCSLTKALFSTLNKDGENSITFAGWLNAMNYIDQTMANNQTLTTIFRRCDPENSGYVSSHSLYTVLRQDCPSLLRSNTDAVLDKALAMDMAMPMPVFFDRPNDVDGNLCGSEINSSKSPVDPPAGMHLESDPDRVRVSVFERFLRTNLEFLFVLHGAQ